MESAATWLRWTRAGTVATVATLLAVAAHGHADGHADAHAAGHGPSLPVALFLVLGLTALAAPLLARPASTLRVVLLTVGGQLAAHSVLTAASGAPGVPGPHAGHLVEQGATGATPGSAALLAELLGLDLRMTAAHLVAAVLVGLWLATGERAVWSLLTHMWRALRLPVTLLPSTPGCESTPAQQQTGITLARLGSGSVVRRGPPPLLAT